MNATDNEIRPQRIAIPEAQLHDLRERLDRTRWSDRETVPDWSQGVPLAWLRDVCTYWREAYDWRRLEAELNGLGSFETTIGAVTVQFLHVKSPHAGARPLLLSHGWPGSIVEFLDAIPRLTRPEAHGGTVEDAFHVVVPSLPGYGFSSKPGAPGFGVPRIAETFVELMRRLGYRRYIAQGGDWGSEVSLAVAQSGEDCIGAHVNFLIVPLPEEVKSAPTAWEVQALGAAVSFAGDGTAYAQQQRTRPQTLGYGLTDSPVGQAAWILEKFLAWTDNHGDPRDAVRIDRLLDNVTLYWLTATATSSARLYWESVAAMGQPSVSAPVAYSVFPRELVRVSRRWAASRCANIVYWNEVAEGGHFAALEEPGLFVDEVRRAANVLHAGG